MQTLEHRRFTEFCEACRRYGYIGLCYGPPGVGKTLSARSYSRWDKVKQSDRWGSGPTEDPLLDTVFYTPSVVNAPNTIQADIRQCRDTPTPAGRMMMQMVGAFAEFERAMLRERTKAGLDSARREGRIGGRRPKLTPQQQSEIRKMVSKGRKTAADAARLFKVHPATVSRLLVRAYAK